MFHDKIEPSDIKQGQISNCWFLSALACLAERPELVERLFVTKDINEHGIYRVRMCKNAEWVLLTIDDYIPCYPGRGPMFSRANGPELWVLLLEKAYAKAHGSYDSLKYGFTKHGMLDLTGFPTMFYEIPTL